MRDAIERVERIEQLIKDVRRMIENYHQKTLRILLGDENERAGE
jgi:uncharacterized protein (UPF0335 family)